MPHIGHSVIGVECFFEAQRCSPGVGAKKLQTQLGTERNAMHQAKFRRPPVPSVLIALSKHGHRDPSLGFSNGRELPKFCPHESMSRSVGIVCFGAEPGKADRDSSSDCLTFLPTGFRTNEKHLVFARGLPGSDLGTMQIHLTVPKRTTDEHSGQAAVALTNFRNTRNSESAIQFCRHGDCIHIRALHRHLLSRLFSQRVSSLVCTVASL